MLANTIKVQILETHFTGLLQWDHNYKAYMLVEYDQNDSIDKIKDDLNLFLIDGFFYISQSGAICIDEDNADVLLCMNFDKFKAVDQLPKSLVNEYFSIYKPVISETAEEDARIIRKLKTKEADLQICLPGTHYIVSRMPLRFTYDHELNTLVYLSLQTTADIKNIYFSLVKYFDYKYKDNVFRFINDNIVIHNLNHIASLVRTHKNAFQLISNSPSENNEMELDKAIREGKITIKMNLETMFTKNREIIFKYDKKISAYKFTNKEILDEYETLFNLNKKIYNNILKYTFKYNPITVSQNQVLKITDIEDIKIILGCKFITYTINKDGQSSVNADSKNTQESTPNQSVLSSLNQFLMMQQKESTPITTLPASNHEINMQILKKYYDEESQVPGFIEFEQNLRTILCNPEQAKKIDKSHVLQLNANAENLQKILGHNRTRKRQQFKYLIGPYLISGTELYIANIEQYKLWWNNPNPYSVSLRKRQKTTNSFTENINIEIVNNNKQEIREPDDKSSYSP